jgi:imidazole glycerol-phosphate synthase subunit HisF
LNVPRIIACLDVDAGKLVKGVRFQGLRIVGDPAEAAAAYEEQGADEVVFLDVSASSQGRDTLVETVRETASTLTIPLTVGGGVRSANDAFRLLRSGADKVAINTAAVSRPEVLREAADAFGSQCVVLAIDAKSSGSSWKVYTHGGSRETGLDVLEWAERGQALGAGELLVTSMDRDGTQDGYDLNLYRALRARVHRPIIASGGCGSPSDIFQVLREKIADAALVASVLHENQLTVGGIKRFLHEKGITVRVT